jgi:RNA polymerase sigma factor for flagellar operon FliA
MSDIAVDMSVSQSRVSQLCTEAIALIRDGMNAQLDPDAVRSLARLGPAGASRTAYYRAMADRNTVAGRLEMSTARGEMRCSVPA